MKDQKISIFQRQPWVALFALAAAVAWGWAYPLIKLGFIQWGIAQSMTGGKMLFAGVRFSMAGIMVLMIARASHKSFKVVNNRDWIYILLFAMLNTTLHYAFFYIGMSYSEGARAAILNSLGTFILVLLACVFIKTDKFTAAKVIGCLMGFTGIFMLNTGGSSSGQFTLMGDGMIILNAICSALAGLMTKGLGKRVDIVVGTGYSLAIGGLFLIIVGLLLGGSLPIVTPMGLFILAALITISALCFAVYNKLLSCNPVGKVAIFNSLIPIVGALTSCWCLDEQFYWKYLFAAIFATAGIYVINRGKQ